MAVSLSVSILILILLPIANLMHGTLCAKHLLSMHEAALNFIVLSFQLIAGLCV